MQRKNYLRLVNAFTQFEMNLIKMFAEIIKNQKEKDVITNCLDCLQNMSGKPFKIRFLSMQKDLIIGLLQLAQNPEFFSDVTNTLVTLIDNSVNSQIVEEEKITLKIIETIVPIVEIENVLTIINYLVSKEQIFRAQINQSKNQFCIGYVDLLIKIM